NRGTGNALQKFITAGSLPNGSTPTNAAPKVGFIRQDKTLFTVSQPAVFNLKIDNSIDVDITIAAGDYSGDEIVAACVAQEASLAPYLIANGSGFKIRGNSDDMSIAKVIITSNSGKGIAEIFGESGSSITRYLCRGNRYKESWHTDFYMIRAYQGASFYHYSPEHWGGANEAEPEKREAGCVWYSEKLPENSRDRECATREEALYRNFQWVLNEKKLVYLIPVLTSDPKIILFLKIEGNGVRGLASAKKLSEANANNCW
ncbi:MAG: hypothetical protein GY757_43050, partial [bacterium]|nr:hypothetical protein [bacterium]